MAGQKGALAQAADQPDSGGYGALTQYQQPPPEAAAILDAATHRLLDGLDALPYKAAAAAMLREPGNFSAALGAGQQAGLDMELATRQMPMAAIGQRAQAELAQTAARQAEMQNRIDMMNFGYLTAPWDTGDGTDQGQGQGLPAGGGPVGGGAAPGAAVGQAGTDQLTEQLTGQNLPVTPQTQQYLQMIQANLQRALNYSRASPMARQHAAELFAAAAQAVREDPLAKEHINQIQKQHEADIGLHNTIRTNLLEIEKNALATAETEVAKTVPEGTQVDPGQFTLRVNARAKQIADAQKNAFGKSLSDQGIDPKPYIQGYVDPAMSADLQAEAAQEPTPAPGAPAPQAVPAPPVQAPPPAVGSAQAPAPQPAPAQPPATDAAGLPAFNPQPTPRNVTRIQQEQSKVDSNVNTLEATLRDLEAALHLNDDAIGGPGAASRLGVVALKDYAYNKVRGLLGQKQQTSQTLYASERLNTILQSSLLARLNQAGPNDELSLGGLQGDNQIQELIKEPIDLDPAVRRALIIRAMRLVAPRLKFERARRDALLQGKILTSQDYPDWVRQSLPLDKAEKLLSGEPEE